MEIHHAQKILDSTEMVNVHYHGIPVYIQEVNEQEGTAKVFPLDSMNHEQLVDLEGLQEVNLMDGKIQ